MMTYEEIAIATYSIYVDKLGEDWDFPKWAGLPEEVKEAWRAQSKVAYNEGWAQGTGR